MNAASKVAGSASPASSLRFHTRAALQFRCGGDASSRSTTTNMFSSLWRAKANVPFWTTSLSASRLFQSTAAAADAETTTVDASASASSDKTTHILADNEEFIKPDRDLRQYRWVTLANNLQVLLVSTTETTSNDEEDDSGDDVSHVEAAAVHVQAGHFDDTIPGLAHFHEHMLFLGTEKYPKENDYETFLSKYGGFSNAYTDMEDTNYYFSLTSTTSAKDVKDNACIKTSEALEGGLDRLAQFFIAPNFASDMVDRECNAIDSEWRNGRTSDSWRNYQHLKASGNPDHPFAKFGCGNLETLTAGNTTSPRPALLEFWKTYYQTYNLRLSVVGHASLDSLQESVEKTFGGLAYSESKNRRIPDTPLPDQIFPYENAQYQSGLAAFGPQQLSMYRQLIPMLESRTLKLQFATPPLDDPVARDSRPHRIISHLLGHESPGSLHALLNDLGYIQGLSSGNSISTTDFSLFALSMALTPKGMANKDHVLDLSFQWISLIKDAMLDPKNLPLMEGYFNELRTLFANNFKFRENGDPTDFCSTVAELMFDTDTAPGKILIGDNDKGEYDPKIAKAYLERMKPSNVMIVETNPDLVDEKETEAGFEDGWQIEPHYGAQYRSKTLSPEQIEAWEHPTTIDSRLRLPALNEYIPTDFSLRCDADVTGDAAEIAAAAAAERTLPPNMIMERPGLRLWHKMDKQWRVPKAFIRFSLVSPAPYSSPRSMTYNRIYQRMLNDDLKSTIYDASLSGCSYSVACTPTGLRVSVQGYNEKLLNLLNTLTSRMLSLIGEMKEGPEAYPALHAKFEKAKEGLLRETKNYRLDAPYEVASYNSRLILEDRVWYLEDYVREMEGEFAERDPMTMEECAQAAEESFTGRHKVEALCMGNINEAEAREACQVVEDHFFSAKTSRPLMEAEIPTFRSLQLPTLEEAKHIFGPDVVADDANRTVPLVYQSLAYSPSEENNAVEYIIQTGSELELEYDGLGILELLAHISYNSAYNQLRTVEQLGYIVSTFTRKTTGGGWGLSVVVQSSVAAPEVLEERIEAWLKAFRVELEEMPVENLAMEAAGVVSQLKERDTKLSQEVGGFWGEIVNTETYSNQLKEPSFDRLDKLSDELTLLVSSADDADSKPSKTTTLNGNVRMTPEVLKQRMLDFMDKYLVVDSPSRRAMSARVYTQQNKELYEGNVGQPGILSSFEDIRHVKQFMPSWPLAPYWRKK